jgi:hypothetical protein
LKEIRQDEVFKKGTPMVMLLRSTGYHIESLLILFARLSDQIVRNIYESIWWNQHNN